MCRSCAAPRSSCAPATSGPSGAAPEQLVQDALRLRGRVRYQNFAIDDNAYLEHSLWSYFDVGYMIKRAFLVQLRYDLYVWLDKRPSTLARIPSPEHRLMLTLEGRF